MPETYRIGDVAARTGRSVHTIRWYESQRLIPGVERDGGGRRVYFAAHLGWLDLLDRLRRTGMSIAEMRAYTALVERGRGTLKQRRDLLAAHRARVARTITEWTEALRLLDDKLAFYGTWIETGHRPREVPRLPASAPRRRAVPAR